MAKENKLEQRVLSAFGSINLKDDCGVHSIDDLAIIFKNYSSCDDYYLIKHDDTDTLHYHFLLKLNKQVRLSTLINFISTEFNVSPLAINIDKCRGFNLCLRYMLHIDESSQIDNKKVFQLCDIVSNQNEDYVKNLVWSDDDSDINWEKMIKGVLLYTRTSDLIKFFGLKNYHKYRFEIRDLLDERLNYGEFQLKYSYLLDSELPF